MIFTSKIIYTTGLQVWVGRLAMMGFTTSIVEEAITKKGTLGQIGFVTPSPPLLITISGAATVGTFVALAVTFYNASTGKMTARQVHNQNSYRMAGAADPHASSDTSCVPVHQACVFEVSSLHALLPCVILLKEAQRACCELVAFLSMLCSAVTCVLRTRSGGITLGDWVVPP